MLKELMVIFLVFSFQSVCAYDMEIRKSLEVGEGEVSYVFDSLQKTKSEIFSVCVDWLSDTYRSCKHVVDQSDREAGIIFIRANEPAQRIYLHYEQVEYTFKIQIKDNKIKTTFTTGKWGVGRGPYCYPSKETVEKMIELYKKLSESLVKKIKSDDSDF